MKKSSKPTKRYKDRRKIACLNTFVLVGRVAWYDLRDGDVVWMTHRRSEHKGGDFTAGESVTVRTLRGHGHVVTMGGVASRITKWSKHFIFWKVFAGPPPGKKIVYAMG